MARPKAEQPSLRYHISGQSIVTIQGRTFYLGKHNSPEALARYGALVVRYQRNGLKLPADFELSSLDPIVSAMLGDMFSMEPTDQGNHPVMVRHITASFRERAKVRYAESHAELHRMNQVCDALDKHDGDLKASEYGPLALQKQRQRWIDEKLARTYCNRLTNIVVRIWKYAVSQELVDETNWRRLKSVEPLRIGQTEAHETDPVKPAVLDDVRKTAEQLSPVLKAMIRIQVQTGMRPGELCKMRPCDIDRSGAEWIYRPAKHKTASKGKTKAVPIMGDARDALTDYMNRDPEAFCFSPRESMAWYRANQRANRTTPLSCGNRPGTNKKANPRKQPGEAFTSCSYRQSIQRAAKRAKVPKWHPYQIRHLAGTVIREALGIEAVQSILGHSTARMSEHYAKQTERAAIAAAKAAPKL